MRKFKQISSALILIVGMILSSNAQITKAPTKPQQKIETFCLTQEIMSEENNHLIQSFLNSMSMGYFDFSNASACVKIYVHVIRRDDGTGWVSTYNVNQSLNVLDEDYNSRNIFFSWDGQIDYIDDTILYNSSNLLVSASVFETNFHTDGIDLYLFPDTGIAYGLANNNSSELLIRGSYGGIALSRSHIISHEMGHVLGLWHTHHGTHDEGDFDVNECPELVNGSNSNTCGDYVIDTPADPKIIQSQIINCIWNSSLVDINGQLYNPDEKNIMSYSTPNCMEYFSNEQVKRMFVAMIQLPHLQSVSNVSLDPLQSGQDLCSTLSSFDFNISPNPTNDILKINVIDNSILDLKFNVEIFNLFNNLVKSTKQNNKTFTIYTSNLNEGLYFIKVDNGKSSIVKSLYVKH